MTPSLVPLELEALSGTGFASKCVNPDGVESGLLQAELPLNGPGHFKQMRSTMSNSENHQQRVAGIKLMCPSLRRSYPTCFLASRTDAVRELASSRQNSSVCFTLTSQRKVGASESKSKSFAYLERKNQDNGMTQHYCSRYPFFCEVSREVMKAHRGRHLNGRHAATLLSQSPKRFKSCLRI